MLSGVAFGCCVGTWRTILLFMSWLGSTVFCVLCPLVLLGMVRFIYCCPVLGFSWDSDSCVWLRPGLLALCQVSSPFQFFREAVWDAWRTKVAGDLSSRAGFRGGRYLQASVRGQLCSPLSKTCVSRHSHVCHLEEHVVDAAKTLPSATNPFLAIVLHRSPRSSTPFGITDSAAPESIVTFPLPKGLSLYVVPTLPMTLSSMSTPSRPTSTVSEHLSNPVWSFNPGGVCMKFLLAFRRVRTTVCHAPPSHSKQHTLTPLLSERSAG